MVRRCVGWRHACCVGIGMLGMLAVAAQAQPSVIKWSQPPDPIDPTNVYYGWNEESTFWDLGPTVADDFVCDNQDPIVHIRFWGSFLGWKNPFALPPTEMPRHFHILFWTDVPADPNVAGSFSHPGRVIHQVLTPYDMYQYQFVGWDFDPRTGEYEACFVFDIDLEEQDWFFQDPTGDPGIYWISISACYD